MRKASIAVLVGVSACASVPSGNDINARTASWQGASTVELVAALGQPSGRTGRGTWVWQFAGPERRVGSGRRHSTHSANTGTLSVIQACPNCSPGQFMTRSGDSRTGSSAPSICTYLGYVEGETVTKLTTLADPGSHCDFEELPPRPTE